MRKFRLIVALLAVALTAWVSPLWAQSNPPPALPVTGASAQTNAVLPANQKSYRLGTNGTLVLKPPPGWVDRAGQIKEPNGSFHAIYFTPPDRNECRLVVEMAGYGDHPDVEGMKALLLSTGKRDLTNSLEPSLTLQDFQGGTSVGAYYRVTDRRLADVTGTATDFRFLTRGFAILGPLVLSFELVSNNADQDEPPVIDVLRQARLVR
jgi:hypothetical protein